MNKKRRDKYVPGLSGFPQRRDDKPEAEQGAYQKFTVERTDGSSAPGEKHDGCSYFVLDLNHDPFAAAALAAYAGACKATHPKLADDCHLMAEGVFELIASSAQKSGADGGLE